MAIRFVFNCFNNWRVAEKQLERFFLETDLEGLDWSFDLVFCHYPLPSVDENLLKFIQLSAQHGINLIVLEKNFGQSRNFNKIKDILAANYPMKPDDVLAFWEPDCSVSTRDWAKACAAVLADKTRHSVGFVTPHRLPKWVLGNQGKEHVIAGHRVRELTWPGGFPMGIYSWGFVEDMAELAACRDYYGGTEMDIVSTLNRCNRIGLMFCDIEDYGTNDHFDPAYIAWKQETIHLPSKDQLDFKDWLQAKGLNALPGT